MQNILRIVTLPGRQQDAMHLICNADIIMALEDLAIPPLQYADVCSLQGWETVGTRLCNPETSSAGFSMNPAPHIALGEYFFARQQGVQRFVLCHELRHAYQALQDLVWQQYMRKRVRIVQSKANGLVQEMWKFLSAPLEVDAQGYAFSKFVEDGSEIVLYRSNEVASKLANYPNPLAHTLRSTVALLPEVYEWRKLLEKGLVLAKSRDAVASNAQTVLDFLVKRTRAGNDARVNSFCIQYLETEPAQFLDVATDFFDYLVTLKD
ncbi:MAG: hypothetical protein K8Q97_00675 [Candidatus Andersenbacteria bacterium]|nr:hypothetical protein [Candidatus Andersenbacteria bacterium]